MGLQEIKVVEFQILLIVEYFTVKDVLSAMLSYIWKEQLILAFLLSNFVKSVLLMPLVETIKGLVSFILKGVDLIDHTSIFLLHTINHYVILILCILSWFVPTRTSSEFFPPVCPPHWDIPRRLLDISVGHWLSWTGFTLMWFLSVTSFEPTIPPRCFDALLGYRVC